MRESEPVYPQSTHPQGPWGGLTKLEWFAGMAMQGFCSNPEVTGDNADIPTEPEWLKDTVRDSFELARAMVHESKNLESKEK